MADKVYVTVGVDGRNIPSGGEQGQYLVKASAEDYDFTWESPGSGGGGSAGTPSITKAPKDTANGALGALTSYARGDHAHPLNIPAAGLPEMDGVAAISKDDSDYYAAFDHVHPRDTTKADLTVQLSDITIEVTDWTEVSADAHYTYDVTALITGGSSKSRIDLYPDYTAILQMDNDGTLGVYVENVSGVFTAHAVGSKPTATLTLQAERTELA